MNTAINAINYGIAKLGIQVIKENQWQFLQTMFVTDSSSIISPNKSSMSRHTLVFSLDENNFLL